MNINDKVIVELNPPETPKRRIKRYAEFIFCSILIPFILIIGCISCVFRLLK